MDENEMYDELHDVFSEYLEGGSQNDEILDIVTEMRLEDRDNKEKGNFLYRVAPFYISNRRDNCYYNPQLQAQQHTLLCEDAFIAKNGEVDDEEFDLISPIVVTRRQLRSMTDVEVAQFIREQCVLVQ